MNGDADLCSFIKSQTGKAQIRKPAISKLPTLKEMDSKKGHYNILVRWVREAQTHICNGFRNSEVQSKKLYKAKNK